MPPAKDKIPPDTVYPYHEKDTVYGIAHDLQNLDLCLPRPLAESNPKDTTWVIFIHGGAWRDPLQNKSELLPALSQLFSPTSPSTTLPHIAGFASLNYGLSTYPPDATSENPSLRVQHPTHITDVVLALSFLHHNYSVGDTYPYILVGHSAGATLAFQALLHNCACAGDRKPPVAVVGLAGIYDLPLLLRNHEDQAFYKTFVDAAFAGQDRRPPGEKLLREVSPTGGVYEGAWRNDGLRSVVLGWSGGDVLVEAEQWEAMRKCLEEQGWSARKKTREVVELRLEGTHDEIWRLGDGVRKGIEVAIEKLFPNR